MSQELYPASTTGGLTDAELRATPVPVADGGASLTVDGTVTVQDGGSTVSIDDGGGSITVDGALTISSDTHDAAAGTGVILTGAYASASAPAAVSADGDAVRLWASRTGVLQVGDGGAALSVDDGGASLTVDGTVNVGTDQHDELAEVRVTLLGGYASASAPTAVSGDGDAVRLWASRTGVLQVGDAGTTLSIDDGAGSITVDGTVAVSGTVAVTDGGSSLTVDDGGSSLTVDGTLDVRGPATSNSTAGSTYYFPVAGYGSSATPTAIGGDGRYTPLWTDTVGRLHTVVDSIGTVTVDSELPAAAALSDALANPTTPMVGSATLLWDGSQWKRVRYTEGTIYSSAARTSTPSAVLISNPMGLSRLHLWLDRTAGGGGSGIQLELYANHIASGVNRRIWVDSALTASGAAVYHWAFGPGLSTTPGAGSYDANMRGHVPLHVPASFYVVMSHLDGTSNTYSLYYSLTP